MRPTTFVANPGLSEGPAENFSNLAIDPYKLPALLQPVHSAPVPATVTDEAFLDAAAATLGLIDPVAATPAAMTTGTTLLIKNDRSYTAQVAVNGTLIGDVAPYTDGALHGLKQGQYDVRFSHTTGYSYTAKVLTTTVEGPIVPGGAGAAVVLPNKGLPVDPKAE